MKAKDISKAAEVIKQQRAASDRFKLATDSYWFNVSFGKQENSLNQIFSQPVSTQSGTGASKDLADALKLAVTNYLRFQDDLLRKELIEMGVEP